MTLMISLTDKYMTSHDITNRQIHDAHDITNTQIHDAHDITNRQIHDVS
jgi:hypothetical protein